MLHAMAKIKANVSLNNRLYNALLEAVHKHQLSVVSVARHDFFPQGMTAVVVLSESHAAIHTFPEWEQVFIDVFTCRAGFDPFVVCKEFADRIGGTVLNARISDRLEGEQRKPFATEQKPRPIPFPCSGPYEGPPKDQPPPWDRD